MAYHVTYPFNFFAKLPDLARQNLTRQMELRDLILLSACSKRCALAIRISRVPAVSFNIELSSYEFKIGLPDNSFCWYIEMGEFYREKKFKIKDIPVTKSRKGALKTKLEKNLDAAFNTAIAQILYIIPSSGFKRLELSTRIKFPDDFSCKVALASVLQVEEILFDGWREDSSDNIIQILENVQATKEIVDRFIHKDTDIIDKKLILKTPNVCFNSAEFLKPFDHFPNTSTETATFRDVQFDQKGLIDFLKWFKSVPASQIQNFKGIKWVNRGDDIEIPDLTEIGGKKADLKLRAQYLPCSHVLCCAGKPITMGSRECTSHFIDTKDGLDIMRSDGLLGTILNKSGAIVFVVWHERFPEQPPKKIRRR